MSSLGMLYGLVLSTGFSATFIVTYATLCVPTMTPNLLGIRGLKRVRAMEQSSLFADVEPALRWSGMQLRRALGTPTLVAIDRQLMLAGDFLGLLPEEFVALCTLGAGSGLAFGSGYSFLTGESSAYALAGCVLGAMVPYSRLTGMQQERRREVNNGLPPIIDLLVLGLSAGLDLPGSIRQVVEKSTTPNDPLIEELGFVLHELNMGKTRKLALTQFAERLPITSVREFTSAVIQAEEHGNPLARVLAIHAEVSRRDRSTRAEEAAAKAGVKMIGPMVMVFGAILILIVGPMLLSANSMF